MFLPATFAGFGAGVRRPPPGNPRWIAIGAVVIGIVLAAIIQALTGYFTETGRRPVKDIGKASETGAATVVLAGISVGFESAVYSALVIGAGVFGAYLVGGSIALFAVALAGCGLLTTVGVIVAMDTFGPISDNAQGIAEMSGDIDKDGARIADRPRRRRQHHQGDHQGHRDRDRRTRRDRAVRLVHRHGARPRCGTAGSNAVARLDPQRLASRRTWSACSSARRWCSSSPAWPSTRCPARRWRSCSRCAASSRSCPGIMDGTQRPEYGKVVDICTRDAQRELVTPGLLAIMAPIAVGFGLGAGALASYLAGAIGAGTLMALFLANSGGAWDNAKKMVEDGAHGGKGSPAHAATVIGDTVGDPFKDTAGPAINPLLKVMNLVSLLIAPAVILYSTGPGREHRAAGQHRGRGGPGRRGRGDDQQAQAGRDRGDIPIEEGNGKSTAVATPPAKAGVKR